MMISPTLPPGLKAALDAKLQGFSRTDAAQRSSRISSTYRSGGSWAELEVDDSGPGVAAGATEKAEQIGHLGLMIMTQRAEAIHGDLSLGRRPGGGTRVRLVWEGEGPTTEEATDIEPGEGAVGTATAEPA